MLGKTAERHTSAEFVAFLTDIVVNQPRGKEIHVIADNRSAHKTKRVGGLLPLQSLQSTSSCVKVRESNSLAALQKFQ